MNDSPSIAPLPYLRRTRDHVKTHERELWDWFASARAKESYADELRVSLLKSTYRLAPESHQDVYSCVSSAMRSLGVEVALTLYQAQSGSHEPNAALFYLPGEAHLVLNGPITTLLNKEELTSVFGHELAHYLLWQMEGEEFLITDRVLDAVCNDPRAEPTHHETARRFRLHTEIFADRGGALVTQNLPAVVSALVKTTTGLSTVDGASYLAQAAEIFTKNTASTTQLTHPESFIRAHALALWTRQGESADATVQSMIAGELGLGNLDILDQQRLSDLSRRFLGELLRPKWFQSAGVLAHARLYFPDFLVPDLPSISVPEELLATGGLLDDYFAFLLLDFARVDPELEDVPLAAALRWAENLGFSPRFEKLVTKELGMSARDLSKLKTRMTDLLSLAEKSA